MRNVNLGRISPMDRVNPRPILLVNPLCLPSPLALAAQLASPAPAPRPRGVLEIPRIKLIQNPFLVRIGRMRTEGPWPA